MTRIHLEKAARILHRGGLIAYPTEAVYGLGCLPWERHAVERLLDVKHRSWREGFVASPQPRAMEPLVEFPADRWPGNAQELAGPVTWVLNTRPGILLADRGGIRGSSHNGPHCRAGCAKRPQAR